MAKATAKMLLRSEKESLPMELRAFDLEFRTEDDEGIFEGHAAVFDKVNSHREIIQKGAFKEALASRGMKGIKMFFGHDRNLPIGKWTEVREDKKGLFVRGKLLLKLEKAAEALLLMKEDILDGLSIGFSPAKTIEAFDQENNQFILSKVDLREISLVMMPSAEDALVTKVRDISPEELTTKLELEKALRNAGISRATSQYIVAGWTPPALRNAEGDQLRDCITQLRNSMSTAKGT